MAKKNMNARMIDAIKEKMIDDRLGYDVPMSYYADKHNVPYEEPKDVDTSFYDHLSDDQKKEFININGRKFIKAFYEENPIKTIRTATGLSQQAFSKKYGIPTRTLTSWETGERKPAHYIVDLLLRVVNAEHK